MELVVICDELTGLGWRLAGAQVEIPEPDAVEAAWHACLARAQLVLITTGMAARLPQATLSAALASSHPLVRVIPDLTHKHDPADPEHEVDRALGVTL
jgi:vacuolar-type H+-ATPase subunit F/Vma7